MEQSAHFDHHVPRITINKNDFEQLPLFLAKRALLNIIDSFPGRCNGSLKTVKVDNAIRSLLAGMLKYASVNNILRQVHSFGPFKDDDQPR